MKKTAFRFKKRYILIVLIGLLVALTAGFFVFQGVKTGKIKFSADTSTTITNIATVTYQDASGNTYTVNSNPVEVQIVTAGAVTLTANPTTINTGGSSTLTWAITDFTVDKCSATPSGWWTNALTGSLPVSPTQTTDYVLTCTEGGTATPVSQTATVTVNDTPVDKLANISFTLDARQTITPLTGITLKAFTPGADRRTANPVINVSNLSSTATGTINDINVNGLNINTNYDFYLYAAPFFGKKLNFQVTSFPQPLNFGLIQGGDANGDSYINAADYSIWYNNDIRGDINGSGEIDANDVWWIRKNITLN